MPSLSPSSVGESPANSFYAQNTPQEPADMYSGSWSPGRFTQMTDPYSDTRGYVPPPQRANPYFPGAQLNEIPGAIMPDAGTYIYGPPGPPYIGTPDVPMLDASHPPSVTDPSGVSTENSPSGGFSEPDQDGRFQCADCPKSYDRKCDLTKHAKCHYKSFRCHLCNKTFSLQKDLRRHQGSVHKEIFKTKRFPCPYPECEFAAKPFPRNDNLTRHLKRIHGGPVTPSSPSAGIIG